MKPFFEESVLSWNRELVIKMILGCSSYTCENVHQGLFELKARIHFSGVELAENIFFLSPHENADFPKKDINNRNVLCQFKTRTG